MSDNGADIIPAVHKLLGKIFHTLCSALIVSLVSEAILRHENIEKLLLKVRKIVLWVKNSIIISDELRKKQADAGIADGCMKKIILDVRTRWNSLFIHDRTIFRDDLFN